MDKHDESVSEEDINKWDDVQADIKLAINNLVWVYLPGKTTLDEAEDISISILDIIYNQWNKVDLDTKK